MSDLEFRGVRKNFGATEVIRGVRFAVRAGEFAVFVGPSGCGKSTLLRIVAGLEGISAGDLFIGGERVNDLPPAKRGVGMVFQSYALYPHMSARENMSFGLKLAGGGRDEVRKRVDEAARMLQLEDLMDRLPRELSGGQRQRVAIGRAIVRRPRVFLFDEPLSNLDAALRGRTRVEIAALHRRLGATMIYVTHDQVEAMTLADRIVVLNHGRVEQIGTPTALYRNPANTFVAGFIGSPMMNFIPARPAPTHPVDPASGANGAASVLAEGASGPIAVPAADGAAAGSESELTLGIRPEHLRASESGGGKLRGKVWAVEEMGESHLLHVRLEGGRSATSRMAGPSRIRIGDAVSLEADAKDFHLFGAGGRSLAAEFSHSSRPSEGGESQGDTNP